jgi:uncharacterized protein (DUF1501 family)
MAITRRQFIKRSGLTAGALLGPSLFAHPLVRQAFAVTGNRYFIVLFLNGGNDGQNTVAPIDNGGGTLRSDYEAARSGGGGGLRLLAPSFGGDIANLLPLGTDPNTGAQLGFHPGFYGLSDSVTTSGDPGFGGLKALYDAGMVAVVQGCGYPHYNLSHDESRKIWQTANPQYLTSIASTGWVGRHLAGAFGSADIPAVIIDNEVSPEFRQFTTSVLAIRRLESFDFPRDNQYFDDFVAKNTAFNDLQLAASGGPQPLKLLGDSGAATYLGTVNYPNAHDEYQADRDSWSAGYGQINRSLSRDLREIAKVIYAQEKTPALAGIAARFFSLNNGGYDTHSDQKANAPSGQHYNLHSEVGGSLKHFFDDLDDIDVGLPGRVTVLVWSEFSRRILQNQNGTDHGSQGPMLLIGGKVNGGIYGQHPNIAESDWNGDGNTKYRQSGDTDQYTLPFRSTDFRDVYGTILTKWLGMSDAAGQLLLPLDVGSATDWWTVSNFDLRRGSDSATLFQP